MRNQTLEQLEGNAWEAPPKDSSTMVLRCYELRKKPLKEFTVEDFRLLINQDLSLEILIPLAIPLLEDNFLAEGDYYEGDLLKSILSSDPGFWVNHPDLKEQIRKIWEKNRSVLADFDTTEDIKQGLEQAYADFMG